MQQKWAEFQGRIEDDRLIFESLGEAPVRLRFTWDATEDGVIRWRNEIETGEDERGSGGGSVDGFENAGADRGRRGLLGPIEAGPWRFRG